MRSWLRGNLGLKNERNARNQPLVDNIHMSALLQHHHEIVLTRIWHRV